MAAPIVYVMKADDLTGAIRSCNTAFVGAVGFYSRSPENIARIRRELRWEHLFINRKVTSGIVDRQPIGGLHFAGSSPPPGGPDYLREFLGARTISENVSRHGIVPAEPEIPEPASSTH